MISPSPPPSPFSLLILRLLTCLLIVVNSTSSFQLTTVGGSFISVVIRESRDRKRYGSSSCRSNISSSRKSIAATSATGLDAVSSSNGNGRSPPRRSLTKRKNKRTRRINQFITTQQRKGEEEEEDDDDHNPYEEEQYYDIEIRPIRRRDAIQAGLDYWIDESDLEKDRLRKMAILQKRRGSGTGGGRGRESQISREKLKEEMVAPYKQNWIGVLSVGVVMLSAIATKFPELLTVPIIPIPDL